MNYTHKAIWDNAKLLGIWLVTLASAVTGQIFNQIASQQVPLKAWH